MSLIEVLIAMGVGSLVLYGVGEFMSGAFSQKRQMVQGFEMSRLSDEVLHLLKKSSKCIAGLYEEGQSSPKFCSPSGVSVRVSDGARMLVGLDSDKPPKVNGVDIRAKIINCRDHPKNSRVKLAQLEVSATGARSISMRRSINLTLQHSATDPTILTHCTTGGSTSFGVSNEQDYCTQVLGGTWDLLNSPACTLKAQAAAVPKTCNILANITPAFVKDQTKFSFNFNPVIIPPKVLDPNVCEFRLLASAGTADRTNAHNIGAGIAPFDHLILSHLTFEQSESGTSKKDLLLQFQNPGAYLRFGLFGKRNKHISFNNGATSDWVGALYWSVKLTDDASAIGDHLSKIKSAELETNYFKATVELQGITGAPTWHTLPPLTSLELEACCP